ncbi:MAG: hypothetical protein AB7Y46_05150 [Armatimonadota bacterium]
MFELRPLGLGDLLDVTWRLFRRHFGRLVPIAAVLYVPIGLIFAAASVAMASSFDTEAPMPAEFGLDPVAIGAMGAVILLYVLTTPLMQAAMSKAVSDLYLGREPRLGDVYRFALRRWASLLGVIVLIGLITIGVYVGIGIVIGVVVGGGAALSSFTDSELGGVVVAVVGTLLGMALGLAAYGVIMVRLFASAFVVVLEDRRATESLSRSWALTAGRFWQTAVALVVLYLFVVILSGIVTWPPEYAFRYLAPQAKTAAAIVQGAMWTLAQSVFQPLWLVGTVLLYYDLRMRKEAFDLVMMAEAIGEPQLAPREPARPDTPLFELPAPPPPPGAGSASSLQGADAPEAGGADSAGQECAPE